MMTITRIGIDLAKQVFQLHGVDERGHTVLRRRVSRTQLPQFFVRSPPWNSSTVSTASKILSGLAFGE